MISISRGILSRLNYVGGGLWECEARNNPCNHNQDVFDKIAEEWR